MLKLTLNVQMLSGVVFFDMESELSRVITFCFKFRKQYFKKNYQLLS
jgi:hypothetical protein